MRIHYLQHVSFEDPANILVWAKQRGHCVSHTLFYDGETLPAMDGFDGLIIMGGPMSVHDEADFSWLVKEKEFIRGAINTHKPILGICLGAQLIAECMGAKVQSNSEKEIGWFPVRLTEEASALHSMVGLPKEFLAFHWHGETFEIPDGAVRLATSEACNNQGFVVGERLIGLQFHLESTPDSVERLIIHGEDDLSSGPFVQEGSAMLSEEERFNRLAAALFPFLDRWSGRV